MFDLNKSIISWKKDFLENEYFTNEDIDELETHLLDSIDELEEKGYSKADAFNKASEDLGCLDSLNSEFNIVNRKDILIKKFVLGIIGFTFINLIVQLTGIIAIILSISIGEKIIVLKDLKIPVIYSLIKFMFGTDYYEEIQIPLAISILLGGCILYLMLSSKRNLLIWVADKVNNIVNNKLIYKVEMFIVVLLTNFLPYIRNYIVANNMELLAYKFTMGQFLFELLFNVMITIGFIYNLNKVKKNSTILWSLGGYITIVTIRSLLPTIVTLSFGVSNEGLYRLKYIIIISILIYITITTKMNFRIEFTNKHKNILIAMAIVGVNIANIFLPPLIVRYIDVVAYGRFSYISHLVGIGLILSAQIILNIVFIKKKNMKII